MFSYFDNVKDKKDAEIISQLRQDMYSNVMKTEVCQIVELDNFPADLDQQLAKLLLLNEGMVGLYKEDDEYYICSVTQVGLPRKDGRPNKVIARYLGKGKAGDYEVKVKDDLVNDRDIVLWYNSDFALPDIITEYYAHELAECDKSIKALVKYSRAMPLYRVADTNEKAQIDKALEYADVDLGKPQTFISDKTFEGLFNKGQEPTINLTDVGNSDKIQYLSHLHLDLMNRFHTIYGLPRGTTSKQAQETVAEVQNADAEGWLIPLAMLKQAKEFCERANKLYGLELVAHFGILHELNFARFSMSCTADTGAHEDICNNVESEGENENGELTGDLQTEKDTE